MHEVGELQVEKRKRITKNGRTIKRPMLIFDKKYGVVYAVGEKTKAFMDKYLEKKAKIKKLDEKMAEDLALIDLSKYDLSVDDTCTLLNYLLNTSGIESVTKLYDLTHNELVNVCKDLQKYGY